MSAGRRWRLVAGALLALLAVVALAIYAGLYNMPLMFLTLHPSIGR